MRRFSDRHHLVTLNDINITPLLDLAFVLLIIFVITTPLLEQSIKLTLPSGGSEDQAKPRKEDMRTVEVSPEGFYVMAGHKMSVGEVEAALVQAFRTNPKLQVHIRADTKEQFGNVMAVVDRCIKHGILKVGFAMKGDKRS